MLMHVKISQSNFKLIYANNMYFLTICKHLCGTKWTSTRAGPQRAARTSCTTISWRRMVWMVWVV